MSKQYPRRHQNHTLENKSINFLKSKFPAEWNVNIIKNDYGQDLNIEIAEDSVFKGLEFVIQLKSSKKSKRSNSLEKQSLKVSNYNYLRNNLRVVLYIKYVEDEDEAYWIMLKDIPHPNQEKKTITIQFPRGNKVSLLNWDIIVGYVKEISHRKLNSVL
ncbi:MAG: DUF4365 domain-containing protein [Ignavibacteriae bacterium]|nr:DUF4365 domain-containing protein [Ignavibacteriota bacterium]